MYCTPELEHRLWAANQVAQWRRSGRRRQDVDATMGRKSPCDQHADLIRELTSRGIGRRQIAREIGVGHQALAAWMDRRGMRSGRPRGAEQKIDRAAISRLLDAGRTLEQVAQALGCARSTIDRASKTMHLQKARTGPRAAEGHPNWKGGRRLDQKGYVEVYVPLHPAAKKPTGYVYEHRLVMEVVLGRYLRPREVPDHRDNHPLHNWPDNLRLFATNAAHLKATLSGREKASPRRSTEGATWSSQRTDPTPSQDDTLALCPSEIRLRIERHIAIHRPNQSHARLPKSKLLRSGAVEPAFPRRSKARRNDSRP